ncbi:hypothetical protein TMM008_21000 [Pseudomonas sp. 008]|nr:hypothetical protein TMM008_21000 [Pseudomonas sp. 008]
MELQWRRTVSKSCDESHPIEFALFQGAHPIGDKGSPDAGFAPPHLRHITPTTIEPERFINPTNHHRTFMP